MSEYGLRCADCGHWTPEDAYYIECPKCRGFLEVELAAVPASPVDDRFKSIFRFHPVMPYDPLTEGITGYEFLETTPVVLAAAVSDRLGVEVYYKDETAMPSGTWKDREGFVSIHRLMKSGIGDLVIFSSGNTATSLARSASIVKGPRLHIVVPKASERRIQTYRQFFDPDFVKLHFFPGSNDECIVEARKLAGEMGYQIEGGFSNYARREGLKLLALEAIFDWDRKVDWYVQPVAGGIGIYSYHKAYRDLGRAAECPKLLGVQASICAPMVHAWRSDAPTLEECHIPQTVVPSDMVRVLRTRRPTDSYPILKRIMDQTNGRFEDVADGEILEALRMFYVDGYYRDVYRRTGKIVGLEPATALAGVVKGVREGYIRKGEKVLLNVSGAAKDGDVKMEWLADLL